MLSTKKIERSPLCYKYGQNREESKAFPLADEMKDSADLTLNQEEFMLKEENANVFQEILKKCLSEKQISLLLLNYTKGINQHEIAKT